MQSLANYGKAQPNLAYLYALVGNFTAPFIHLALKEVTNYITPFQAMFLRSLFVTLIITFCLWKAKLSPHIQSKKTLRLILIRVSLTALSLSVNMYCTKFLPISTVLTLWNLAPIFIFLIEAVHYNQAIPTINLLFAFICFLGVVLIVQPQFFFGAAVQKIEYYYVYVGMMVLAAFVSALNVHFIHILGKKLEPLVSMFYNNTGGLVVNAIILCLSNSQRQLQPISATFWVWLATLGVFAFLTQTFLSLANIFKKPSLIMPFGYISILLGYLLDVYLYDTKFTVLTTIGIFLTTAGVLSGYIAERARSVEQVEPIDELLSVLSQSLMGKQPRQPSTAVEIELNEIIKVKQDP